jgi:hypothetical protein
MCNFFLNVFKILSQDFFKTFKMFLKVCLKIFFQNFFILVLKSLSEKI